MCPVTNTDGVPLSTAPLLNGVTNHAIHSRHGTDTGYVTGQPVPTHREVHRDRSCVWSTRNSMIVRPWNTSEMERTGD